MFGILLCHWQELMTSVSFIMLTHTIDRQNTYCVMASTWRCSKSYNKATRIYDTFVLFWYYGCTYLDFGCTQTRQRRNSHKVNMTLINFWPLQLVLGYFRNSVPGTNMYSQCRPMHTKMVYILSIGPTFESGLFVRNEFGFNHFNCIRY
jgi:hypothetical protein